MKPLSLTIDSGKYPFKNLETKVEGSMLRAKFEYTPPKAVRSIDGPISLSIDGMTVAYGYDDSQNLDFDPEFMPALKSL